MINKKGSLTIEASIGITSFMFIVLMVLGMSRVYNAQSLISHATLQTSQSLAIETYYRETFSGSDTAQTVSIIAKFVSAVGWDAASDIDDGYASLGDKGTDFYKILKEKFAYAIAGSTDEANKVLLSMGVKDGLDGIDFTSSAIQSSEIIVHAKYTVELPFSFFGNNLELKLSKSAKSKAFKKIESDKVFPNVSPTPTPKITPTAQAGGRFYST